MRRFERDDLRDLSLDELHRIHRTLIRRYAGFDNDNILAIGFGGKVAEGHKQSQARLSVRFHVRNKRLPRTHSDRLPDELTVRFKRDHRFIEARFKTDVVSMARIKSTGCRIEYGNQFCTGGCLVLISNFEGAAVFERWAVLTVGHAFRSEAIPVEVLIRGRNDTFPNITGSIRIRTDPARRPVFDVALCEVSRSDAVNAGLNVGASLQTPRGDLLIKDDAEDRRTGYLLRENAAGNRPFVISDYFPELEIPQLGKLHSMVRAEADSSLFVGGTSGAAWCVTNENGQLQPVAMQIAEEEDSTIGYGQSYFSILVEWMSQHFPNKRIRIHSIIDSQA